MSRRVVHARALTSWRRRSTASSSFSVRLDELLDRVDDQLVRHLLQRNAGLLERGQHRHGAGDILFEAGTQPSVVAEGRQRVWRHGVDRVGSDQFLDIQDVAVAAGSWCRCSPRARVAPAHPFSRAPPTAVRRRSSCSSGTRAWRWRSRPCRAALRASPCPRPSPSSASFRVCASTSVSMRLTKKLATLATCVRSPPAAARASRPSIKACATASYALRAKSSVTLTLMPSLT